MVVLGTVEPPSNGHFGDRTLVRCTLGGSEMGKGSDDFLEVVKRVKG